ncbi:hypothetical protein CI109_106923 [Kwoniella shandongensis]|uniref:Uncharacterized protein n=1 Tax=Kwoniella shandongensis TaxID=1734106 RepID=A0A5M6CA28_9TREE|nr:uncharacterized protein CI109_000822 [Kwoniella shandongensis]KAA5530642.1 hypothetical protein CI109_000822 [Kwoniella shandongensis]
MTAQDNDNERKFHHFHCDPQHDFIIKSNDGMHFRASRFHLARVSTFFADMFSTATSSSTVNNRIEDIITLDYSAAAIKFFLDLAHSSDPKVPSIEFVSTAASLFDLTTYTMCKTELQNIARESLYTAGKRHPMDLLVIASHRQDSTMAKTALSYINYNPWTTSRKEQCQPNLRMFLRYLDRLDPTYAYELVRNLLTVGPLPQESSKVVRYGFFLTPNWSSIADKFDPERRAESSKRPDESSSKKRKL